MGLLVDVSLLFDCVYYSIELKISKISKKYTALTTSCPNSALWAGMVSPILGILKLRLPPSISTKIRGVVSSDFLLKSFAILTFILVVYK